MPPILNPLVELIHIFVNLVTIATEPAANGLLGGIVLIGILVYAIATAPSSDWD